MANNMIDKHFENFVKKNSSPRYEDWIAALHPDSASDGLLGMGETIIDSKFYEADNEYRKYWNNHLDSTRSPVPGSSSDNSGNESDGSANGYRHARVDLISGDGDDDSQSSPTSAPRRAVNISPGEDLMKFD